MAAKIWTFTKAMYVAAIQDIEDYPHIVFWVAIAYLLVRR